MIYGYARVSTREQNLDRQFESLERYVDKENIYFDKQSGKDMNRKQYQELKKAVKKGDEIYFHELDRLGRNKEEMIREIKSFKENGVVVRILDVPTTMVKIEGQEWVVEMINNILIEVLSSVAENERKKIRNRQQEGIKIALEKGVKFGRDSISKEIIENAKNIVRSGGSVASACKKVGISRKTYYKYAKQI